MKQVNIHEAKTHLSHLVELAAKGQPFVIAKAGKPMVKVVPVDAPKETSRLGFMSGEILTPEDFDSMGSKQIARMFGHKA
ncbi:MAG TPA: type II toxin-antitoxin system prevent-host-death family antitoxin [Candidatus Obscuribacterales bacterium]